MTEGTRQTIRDLLDFLYGAEQGAALYPRLMSLLDDFRRRNRSRARKFDFVTERDVVLITYGDILTRDGQAPLDTLNEFLRTHVQGLINTVHILPFFPYSSDDGFSVINYRAVDPALGTWQDVEQLCRSFKLMFDLVLNHVSAHSECFQAFLKGDEAYREYFIATNPTHDLSMVTRPRTHALLTPFDTADGIRHVWTTFSADQIDLNFANPKVLLEMIDVLLFYVERGASLIRLDAIAYVWKEIDTTCIHLPKTHAVVQLLRAVVDDAAPSVLLITETNVPHEENISYFGDGTNEAHLVYQFALPPLIAHSLLTGSAAALADWAAQLKTPSLETHFFNFTASHDGIGVRPATGILSDQEIEALVRATLDQGGQVSYKTNTDGSRSPYELNITYYSLLNNPVVGEPQALQVQRFLVSQAIMLALAGVPGIYFHSLIGSRNNTEGATQTGHARTINREKLQLAPLEACLQAEGSVEQAVFDGYTRLLRARIAERAFHPNAHQRTLAAGEAVFGLLRRSADGEAVIALHNVSNTKHTVALSMEEFAGACVRRMADLLTGEVMEAPGDDSFSVKLEPYQIRWLKVQ